MPALELTHLAKQFGRQRAVNDRSLSDPRGASCDFIEPNGSGKITTLRMGLNIIRHDRSPSSASSCSRRPPEPAGAAPVHGTIAT
jgi:ABC-type uncharacterized transport system ATPase subunit